MTGKFSQIKIDSIMKVVREYQRTGQHKKAIELCTQTLDKMGEGDTHIAQRQMDLLFVRGESYLALLQIDKMEKNTDLMLELSKKEDKPTLKAQALAWDAIRHETIQSEPRKYLRGCFERVTFFQK